MQSPIRDWRHRHHVTQAALAQQMGLSAATLSQKEQGKLSWRRKDLRFFKSHGLSADYVLGFDPTPPRTISAMSEVEKVLLRLVARNVAQRQ